LQGDSESELYLHAPEDKQMWTHQWCGWWCMRWPEFCHSLLLRPDLTECYCVYYEAQYTVRSLVSHGRL